MREHEPIISIASSQRPWAAELVRFLTDYGGARLAGTVLTASDAIEQDYEILIIDDIASYLSPRLIDRIRRAQKRVIAVYDPDSGTDASGRLEAMGVDAMIVADAGSDELLEIAASLSSGSRSIMPTPVETPIPTPAAHRVVLVVGGDLATDVALGLGNAFTAHKRSTLVFDADTVAPSIAQRLAKPLVPNLLTALDALVQLRGDVRDSLVDGPSGMKLLLGLPEPTEWESIRAGDVLDLVEQIASSFDEVVVKSSEHIEDLSQFAGRAGRFEVSRTLLRRTSDVVYVAKPTPIGLSRTLSWIASARQMTDARVHVVFGQAPSSLFQRGELSEELTRSFVPASIVWLPDDPRLNRAVWNGEPVATGPFLKSVGALGDALGVAVA